MKNDTRLKIMKTALELFSKKGYYQTTTKEIAYAAQVNELTVFRHFGSKANLLQEITEYYLVDAKVDRILKDTDDLNFEDLIVLISRRVYKLYWLNADLYRIQMKLSDDDEATVKLKLSRSLVRVFTDYFKALKYEGKINGDPELMAVTLINSLLGILTVYVLGGGTVTDIPCEKLVVEHAKQFANFYTLDII